MFAMSVMHVVILLLHTSDKSLLVQLVNHLEAYYCFWEDLVLSGRLR